jgi:hypothetical protein
MSTKPRPKLPPGTVRLADAMGVAKKGRARRKGKRR